MKPSSIYKVLPTLFTENVSVFLWGSPGVGKSDLIAQIAKDLKLELRDVRMSLLDPVDMKGFPVPNLVKKQMNWLPADFLPTKGKGILLLDEMNSAPQTVQASAYQLVLNRRIGDYVLPPGWHIVAAGNYTTDRSVVYAQPAALSNRFVHLDYDVNNDDWNAWAITKDIHSDIRAFLRFRPSLLYTFDPKVNPRAFATPRSWAFVNKIYRKDLSQDDQFELIKGTVGEGASAEFSGFVRLIKDLPTVDEVLKNPTGTPIPKTPAAKFAIVTALDAKTTPANMVQVMSYITRKEMEIEYQAVFMRGAIRRNAALMETPSFIKWGTENQSTFV